MVRATLRMVLEDEPDLLVVGEAADGAAARELVHELRPEVLLADMRMPPPDGIELARLLCREAPDVRTIIVSAHEDAALVREALAAGAVAFVAKRAGPEELLEAIRRAVPRVRL
jgi:DNA-binding NarL/FixJ family response regulator